VDASCAEGGLDPQYLSVLMDRLAVMYAESNDTAVAVMRATVTERL
jgi:hypothetical protein